MATLKEIELELITEAASPIEKISLYAEVVLMIVQFIIGKNIIVGGKIVIKWYDLPLFISIIGLFKQIVEKLTGEKPK